MRFRPRPSLFLFALLYLTLFALIHVGAGVHVGVVFVAHVRARLGLGRDTVRGARAYLVRHRDDTGRLRSWRLAPSSMDLALDAGQMPADPGTAVKPNRESKGGYCGRAS